MTGCLDLLFETVRFLAGFLQNRSQGKFQLPFSSTQGGVLSIAVYFGTAMLITRPLVSIAHRPTVTDLALLCIHLDLPLV